MMVVLIIAGVTFREALRKKLVWIALAAGFAFLTLFGTGLHYQAKDFAERGMNPMLRREIVRTMLTLGLYAIDLLTVIMAVLTSVDTISGEIASGTIEAVATKPVHRWEVLVGKWLGFAAMLTGYLAVMVGGVNLLTYFMGGVIAHHLARGFALMLMEGVLLLTVCFLFGTMFSSLTTGVFVLGLHGLAFIGGWIEQAGAISNSPRAVKVGILASVLMPSEALWRRAAYEMQSQIAGAMHMTPFGTESVPSLTMIVYAGVYLLLALSLAIRHWSIRDL
jgi:ABC-2 type transport system permease protein